MPRQTDLRISASTRSKIRVPLVYCRTLTSDTEGPQPQQVPRLVEVRPEGGLPHHDLRGRVGEGERGLVEGADLAARPDRAIGGADQLGGPGAPVEGANLIVIFLTLSCLNLTVLTPDTALTTVDFPCATCPTVPTLRVACLLIT